MNLSTNFCCRYIICQELDEVSVKKGIQQIIKEDMACRQNIIDPDIDIITNFYNNDDDEILNSFKNIIKKLEENKFSARDLGTIASYTIYLKNYIVFDNKKILDLIVDCIKEDKISWDYPFYSRIIQDNETSKKEFNDLVELTYFKDGYYITKKGTVNLLLDENCLVLEKEKIGLNDIFGIKKINLFQK